MTTIHHRPLISYHVTKGYHNHWCLIGLNKLNCPANFPFIVRLHLSDSHQWEGQYYLTRGFGMAASRRTAIIYIPENTDFLEIIPIHNGLPTYTWINAQLIIKKLPRLYAAFLLACRGPGRVIETLISSPKGLKRRLQSALSQNINAQQTGLNYRQWYFLYGKWTKRDQKRLYESKFRSSWPSIEIQLHAGNAQSQKSTLLSLKNQWFHAKRSQDTNRYIAILQNGETLPPQSLAVFADQAARHGFPAALYADSDQKLIKQTSVHPIFKPQFNLPLLVSGILTQDLWLFRHDIVEMFEAQYSSQQYSAYTRRLALALWVWEKNLPVHHVPFLLSHRNPYLSHQLCTEMRQMLNQFFQQKSWNVEIKDHTFPLDIRFLSHQHPVSFVIPTAAQSKEITSCLKQLIEHTYYPVFEVILVVTQPHPLTAHQNTVLEPIINDPRVNLCYLKEEKFNFSRACNFGVQQARYPFIALLNDDVAPINSDWLTLMMGHMQNPHIGAVGAQLLYPDGRIQHAGIIMGLAWLCEHAGRFHHPDEATFQYDHAVSAVTAACMLIRREAFDQVNGFDESYEIAYNDVDFCLRLGEKHWQIVQCQKAKLTHYESFSLGNHYQGERAGKERQEILSMWHRWRKICQDDPFYNPNLSLQRGMDGKPAFPPRITHPFANRIESYEG